MARRKRGKGNFDFSPVPPARPIFTVLVSEIIGPKKRLYRDATSQRRFVQPIAFKPRHFLLARLGPDCVSRIVKAGLMGKRYSTIAIIVRGDDLGSRSIETVSGRGKARLQTLDVQERKPARILAHVLDGIFTR